MNGLPPAMTGVAASNARSRAATGTNRSTNRRRCMDLLLVDRSWGTDSGCGLVYFRVVALVERWKARLVPRRTTIVGTAAARLCARHVGWECRHWSSTAARSTGALGGAAGASGAAL